MKLIVALLCVLLPVVLSQSQNVTISLFATDLSGCDDLSKCDPFVRIFCQSRLSDWRECGKTSVRDNDNFPIWPEIFTFNITEGNRDKWRFKIIDEDVAINDPIAEVEVTVEEFLNATEIQNTYSFNLDVDGNGKFYVQRIR